MDAIDQFYDIVRDLDDHGDVVAAWRTARSDKHEYAESKLSTGIHIIESEMDFDGRTITLLTEMGDSLTLGWEEEAIAATFDLMVEAGEAEVVTATTDPTGAFVLCLTDGAVVLTGHFDVFDMSTFGFFD